MAPALARCLMLRSGATPAPTRLVTFSSRAQCACRICSVTGSAIFGRCKHCRHWTNLTGSYGRCALRSNGKDTTTGHWEMAGIILEHAFPTYPNGFPAAVIDRFVRETTVPGILGNIPASGTEIIKVLGEEHVKTRKPIVYTSADSVFQIAAHEEVIPLERLYEICEIARRILDGEHKVGRVIARPFLGQPGCVLSH